MICNCSKRHKVYTDKNGINFCTKCKKETEILRKYKKMITPKIMNKNFKKQPHNYVNKSI
jgi:ribosomal protein L37AE/L43A